MSTSSSSPAPRCALVGYTGFVGSNLRSQAPFGSIYNSKNIEDIAGNTFELLVFAGAQAKKWWANQEPEADWQGIDRALRAMATVKADRAVLISTIDAVPPGVGLDEAADCHAVENHAYGHNRLALEDAFRAHFDNPLIVRLPGLFGPGLRKNVIYDLLTDNILDKINPASSFQYYDLTRLWGDIQTAERAGLSLVHLVTEPVATSDILDAFFPDKRVGWDAAPEATYDFRTRHGATFAGAGAPEGYIEGKASVLARMGRFIEAWRAGPAKEAGPALAA
jgi:hypothetical protein